MAMPVTPIPTSAPGARMGSGKHAMANLDFGSYRRQAAKHRTAKNSKKRIFLFVQYQT
jgi:hypothetical protein